VKERIITAICMLAVVLPLIYFGGYWFAGLMLIATVIATWEMIAMHNHLFKVPMLVKALLLISTLGIAFVPDLFMALWVSGVAIFLLIACYALKKITVETSIFYLKTLIYIGFSFKALLAIRNHSLSLFIFLIAIVILTDSAAYFTGRFFGKHKLAPKISPKKTVEGAIGGWLIGSGFALFFGVTHHLFTERWMLMVLAIGLPILSQVGDLVASSMKRKYGIKDYGKLFPGHGGVMDRVDSQLLAALLIYGMIQIGGVLS